MTHFHKCEIGGHLGFFHVFRPFTHIIMVCHVVKCVYLIPWRRKYMFRPQNHDPTWSNFRDIGNLKFWGGHFEKRPKLVVSPSFFLLVTSLIWFLRVPWTKWYHSRRIMGGCTGTPVSSLTTGTCVDPLFTITPVQWPSCCLCVVKGPKC